MSEWKKVKLGDISISNRGYYGIGASAVPYDSKKYTYLRITDINDDSSLNSSDLKSVDDLDAEKYLLKKNYLFRKYLQLMQLLEKNNQKSYQIYYYKRSKNYYSVI